MWALILGHLIDKNCSMEAFVPGDGGVIRGFACSALSLSGQEKAPGVGVPSPLGAYELVRGQHFNKIS